MIKYLVFDIGCMECGESSQVVGLYPTKEEAEDHAATYYLVHTDWHGEHRIDVFELEVGE